MSNLIKNLLNLLDTVFGSITGYIAEKLKQDNIKKENKIKNKKSNDSN